MEPAGVRTCTRGVSTVETCLPCTNQASTTSVAVPRWGGGGDGEIGGCVEEGRLGDGDGETTHGVKCVIVYSLSVVGSWK